MNKDRIQVIYRGSRDTLFGFPNTRSDGTARLMAKSVEAVELAVGSRTRANESFQVQGMNDISWRRLSGEVWFADKNVKYRHEGEIVLVPVGDMFEWPEGPPRSKAEREAAAEVVHVAVSTSTPGVEVGAPEVIAEFAAQLREFGEYALKLGVYMEALAERA